jgi:hypothetical protein
VWNIGSHSWCMLSFLTPKEEYELKLDAAKENYLIVNCNLYLIFHLLGLLVFWTLGFSFACSTLWKMANN